MSLDISGGAFALAHLVVLDHDVAQLESDDFEQPGKYWVGGQELEVCHDTDIGDSETEVAWLPRTLASREGDSGAVIVVAFRRSQAQLFFFQLSCQLLLAFGRCGQLFALRLDGRLLLRPRSPFLLQRVAIRRYGLGVGLDLDVVPAHQASVGHATVDVDGDPTLGEGRAVRAPDQPRDAPARQLDLERAAYEAQQQQEAQGLWQQVEALTAELTTYKEGGSQSAALEQKITSLQRQLEDEENAHKAEAKELSEKISKLEDEQKNQAKIYDMDHYDDFEL